MLQPMLKDDQERCESWDKEVQNILIFVRLMLSSSITHDHNLQL